MCVFSTGRWLTGSKSLICLPADIEYRFLGRAFGLNPYCFVFPQDKNDDIKKLKKSEENGDDEEAEDEEEAEGEEDEEEEDLPEGEEDFDEEGEGEGEGDNDGNFKY